jgi:NAD(P)-dependent dehydrogenase (short-subunit alcohol dehydrogenase family)
MDLGLSDAVAIVTASSKGLGLGTAKALSAEGPKVVLCARDDGKGCKRRRTPSDETLAVAAADVTDPPRRRDWSTPRWNASGRCTSWSPTPAVPSGTRASRPMTARRARLTRTC